jgi:hypothetical protein
MLSGGREIGIEGAYLLVPTAALERDVGAAPARRRHGRYEGRETARTGDTIGPMTTREKAHKLLDELPESEIEPVLDFIVARGPNGAGCDVEEWGDLDAQTDAATAASMHDLDEAERAEFGETIAEAWKYESPR